MGSLWGWRGSGGSLPQTVPMSDDDKALTELAHQRVDALFERHRTVFNADFDTYRGHVQRVLGLTALQVPLTPELVEPVCIAAFYHDAGIWFDHTGDYLPISAQRAGAALEHADCGEYAALVTAMIDEHHRLRRAHHPHPLVEAMRRSDPADIFRMVMPPGVDRRDYLLLRRRYPSAGLHAMLGRAFLRGLRESPGKPLPMVKL